MSIIVSRYTHKTQLTSTQTLECCDRVTLVHRRRVITSKQFSLSPGRITDNIIRPCTCLCYSKVEINNIILVLTPVLLLHACRLNRGVSSVDRPLHRTSIFGECGNVICAYCSNVRVDDGEERFKKEAEI